MIQSKSITQEQLKQLVFYNEDVGEFYWKSGPKTGELVGIEVNCGTNIYRRVKLYKRAYYIHVLVWLYFNGVYPTDEIDHKDRNGLNNKLSNLREATRSQQNMNKLTQRNSSSGVKGVTPFKGKWQVHIKKDGFRHYLGLFADFEKAVLVRKKAEEVLFGEFAA